MMKHLPCGQMPSMVSTLVPLQKYCSFKIYGKDFSKLNHKHFVCLFVIW